MEVLVRGQVVLLTSAQVHRFWSMIDRRPDGCWLWLGRLDRHGYGSFKVKPRLLLAHRVAYQLEHGGLTMELDHLCRTRACVNPDHLEPVTSRENTMRSPVAAAAVNSRRLVCASGHLLADTNVYLYRRPGARHAHRACRTCRSAARRRFRAQG